MATTISVVSAPLWLKKRSKGSFHQRHISNKGEKHKDTGPKMLRNLDAYSLVLFSKSRLDFFKVKIGFKTTRYFVMNMKVPSLFVLVQN